ncbi:glycosyltransferase [Oceanispirochaeta crateris]|uniref:Glycosyltransferase n=2 Tax=Oceanispirochaeta crateris TaxID=2518645 RepID=A0A5C1QHC1_9SPIO|nr:glycosyltransferase [Oceanispirochaeta crateris]
MHIDKLWESLIPVLQSLHLSWEILFVDDGSLDDTVEKILTLRTDLIEKSGALNRVRIIRLNGHFGQQSAVYCGLEQSHGDRILTMDDDLQHPPQFIPQFLSASQELDVLFALPQRDERSHTLRWGSKMRDRVFRLLLKAPRGIKPGSFRVFNRKSVDLIKGSKGPFVYVSALLFRRGGSLKMGNIDYETPPAQEAKSRFTQTSRIVLTLKLMWYYVFIPLFIKNHEEDQKPYIMREEL